MKNSLARTLGLTGLACALMTGAGRSGADTASPPIHVAIGETGVVSIKDGTTELLKSGAVTVSRVVLSDWEGVRREGDVTRRKIHADPKRGTVTQEYDWGTIGCTYTVQGNCLKMAVQVGNTSLSILKGVSFSVAVLGLPGSAKGLIGQGQVLAGVEAPGVLTHDWGGGALAFCNEQVGRPLYVGLLPVGGDAKTIALQAATFRDDRFPSGWLSTPNIDRAIFPGNTDHFTVSLRLGRAGASPSLLAGDIFKAYADAFPATLNWKDRRPIGTLHLGAVEFRGPKNPRGWLTSDGNVDTSTDAGREAFRKRILRYADDSVAIMKDMGAQGMIVWDIEGDEHPHATTYIGDPRSLPDEIAPVIDAFFKRFTDVGLRVGICIRPSYPVRSIYGAGATQIQPDDPAYVLNEKIGYAHKRWGCSIFYVDSNVNYDRRFKPNDEHGYELMSSDVFRQVAAANPDVLLMPEHKDTRYYAYAMPYMELRQHYPGTPDRVRAVYPGGFSAIYVPDGPIEQHRQELLASVKRGDILLFRAWWPDEYNAQIKALYEAGRK